MLLIGSISALHASPSSELSSETGPQPSVPDFEAELRELQFSVLTELERRKQAEESLRNTRAQWQKIREELSVIGLTLPVDLVAALEDINPIRELSQQFDLARFVSNSIGRGTAKAEVEMEMEALMELKNFEIARLLDRLHYYEAVNREMSQRNQETIGEISFLVSFCNYQLPNHLNYWASCLLCSIHFFISPLSFRYYACDKMLSYVGCVIFQFRLLF